MIPKQFITAWGNAGAPWQADSQVEQDLLLSRVLVELYSNSYFHYNLAFKGGTALQKLFVEKPVRYSEDIDLVQIKSGPIGKVMTEIREVLTPWLGKPKKYIQNEYGVKFMYRYEAEGGKPMRLKIEINTREQFSVLGFQELEYTLDNPWYSGRVRIRTYKLEELLGTKLKALYQRKKGRDLFDIDYFLNNRPNLDWKQVIYCFQLYADHEGVSLSREKIEKNFIMKSLDPTYYRDITPLLTLDASNEYQVNRAFNSILEKICPLLDGPSWKYQLGENSPLYLFISDLRKLNDLDKNNPQREKITQRLRTHAQRIIQKDDLMKKSNDFNLGKEVKRFQITR